MYEPVPGEVGKAEAEVLLNEELRDILAEGWMPDLVSVDLDREKHFGLLLAGAAIATQLAAVNTSLRRIAEVLEK